MNEIEIKKFIEENSSLFWYIKPEAKKNISEEFLVETILNYGNIHAVKKLFQLLGRNKVAKLFSNLPERRKLNYLPQVRNFFTLYFKKHAQGNS